MPGSTNSQQEELNKEMDTSTEYYEKVIMTEISEGVEGNLSEAKDIGNKEDSTSSPSDEKVLKSEILDEVEGKEGNKEGLAPSPSDAETVNEEDLNVEETPIPGYRPSKDAEPITEDRKIWKEIITEGEGEFTPGRNMQVIIQYVGWTFGLEEDYEFENTDQYQDPLEFIIGCRGTTIVGLEAAVTTMKKKQKATFFCHSDYAFAHYKVGVIPPNCHIKFEVELLNWIDDCCPIPEVSIIRERIKKPLDADEERTPKCGAWVEVELEGRYGENIFYPKQIVDFFVGNGDFKNLPKGIDVAITHFFVGEESVLTIDPLMAFGEEGNTELGVPSNAKVTYHVKLRDFKNLTETPEALSIQDRVFLCKGLIEIAEKLMESQSFERALKKYKRIEKYMSCVPIKKNNFEEIQKELLFKSRIGQTKCSLIVDPDSAQKVVEKIDNILKEQTETDYLIVDFIDALVTEGQAFLELGEPKKCMECLKSAKEKDPNNIQVNEQLTICQQKFAEQAEKDKKLAGSMRKMFS